ncbi:MAG: hypothetical protein ACFB2Y_24845 [Fulvivirga sp.]
MKKLLFLIFILFKTLCAAQENYEDHNGEISQQTSHLVSNVSFLLVENETVFFDEEGFDEEPENKTVIQPIVGLRIFNNKITLAMRASFEFVSVPHELHSPSDDDVQIERVDGFGDAGLMTLLSTKSGHECFVWGLGFSSLFPTASQGELGSRKYQIGPAAALFYLGEELGDLFKIGNLPIKWRVEGQYYIESSESEGEKFGMVFTLEPILSSLFN